MSIKAPATMPDQYLSSLLADASHLYHFDTLNCSDCLCNKEVLIQL